MKTNFRPEIHVHYISLSNYLGNSWTDIWCTVIQVLANTGIYLSVPHPTTSLRDRQPIGKVINATQQEMGTVAMCPVLRQIAVGLRPQACSSVIVHLDIPVFGPEGIVHATPNPKKSQLKPLRPISGILSRLNFWFLKMGEPGVDNKTSNSRRGRNPDLDLLTNPLGCKPVISTLSVF